MLVEVNAVFKFYPDSGEGAALSEVSLTLKKGACVVLVGQGGAGKSTLLSLIRGETVADAGEVCVDGEKIARLSGAAQAALRRKMGIVFQDLRLPPYRTVFQQVALLLEVAGGSLDAIRRRVREVLERVDLARHADRRIGSLTVGEQQRVAVARALAHHPLLILADEPTAHLDETMSDAVLSLLEEAQVNGATLCIATRQAALASKIRGEAVPMQQGRRLSDANTLR